MDIKKKTDSLARRFKTRNPFEILRGMNAILVFAPLIDTRAFYQYFQRNNIIYIDENLSRHDQTFECAHEMGHMCLHKKANTIFMDTRTELNTCRYEREADLFAMSLLVSDDMIAEYQQCSVDQLSRVLGYEKRLVELRLKQPTAF